jgi:hypothetical protein
MKEEDIVCLVILLEYMKKKVLLNKIFYFMSLL